MEELILNIYMYICMYVCLSRSNCANLHNYILLYLPINTLHVYCEGKVTLQFYELFLNFYSLRCIKAKIEGKSFILFP